MKYSKEMMEAHEKSIKSYERMIHFARDTKNPLSLVRDRALNFYQEGCNYCRAVSKMRVGCGDCILKTSVKIGDGTDCSDGGMGESYGAARPYGPAPDDKDRKRIVKEFTARLDALVLQAEFNLSEKGPK